MNKKMYIAKNSFLKQKKFYVFLISLMLVGIISGIVLVFFLKDNDKKNVCNNINSFFYLIKTSNGINYGESLLNSLLINLGYIIIIWLLGISIIGFPIVIGILFFKCFVIGFSVAGIIMNYGIKGLLGAFLYLFPHQIMLLIIYLLISFYSLSFCYKIFSHLFLKKTINFKYGMDKYVKILVISIIFTAIISFYEVFVSTYFMKIFTFLIK